MILLKYALLVLSVETLWLCTWEDRQISSYGEGFFPFVTYTQSKYFVSYRQSFESCMQLYTQVDIFRVVTFPFSSKCVQRLPWRVCKYQVIFGLDWLWEHALLLLRIQFNNLILLYYFFFTTSTTEWWDLCSMKIASGITCVQILQILNGDIAYIIIGLSYTWAIWIYVWVWKMFATFCSFFSCCRLILEKLGHTFAHLW